jgi:hypothetical protein
MANSPTLCQKFVSQAISPFRYQFSDAYIIHYVDDILLAHSEEYQLNLIFDALQLSLTASRLCLAPENVQKRDPYSYLGHLIEYSWIKLLHPQIRTDNLRALNNFQKLLGDINSTHFAADSSRSKAFI